MFSVQDPSNGATPLPPGLLDFDLPDALRRARHAALLPLMASLYARGWNEPKLLLLNALVQAGEALPQGVAAARAGLNPSAMRFHIAHLIEDGYITWVAPAKRQYPYIVARDIGRRQINHIVRELARGGARSWASLAALPDDVRVTERMCARLFELMETLTHACAGDAMETRANAPAGLPEPEDLVCVTLPLQARRARSALVKRIGAVLRHYDLTEAQWRILRILTWQRGLGWTRRGLERRGCFHFSDPAVQRGLFTLSQRGLADKDDTSVRPKPYRTAWWGPRRQFRAIATRTGHDMIARIEAKEREICADLFARLTTREMDQLDRLLARVTSALLWQDGVAEDEQDTHPFAAHYRAFEDEVKQASRDHARSNRILRQNGLPVPKRHFLHWWE
jgi:DNA-binding MarR family transcriptional regulator